jgi:hypothetical protein
MHGGHSLYKGKVWHVAITTITDLGPNELLFIKKKIWLELSLLTKSKSNPFAGVTHNISAC